VSASTSPDQQNTASEIDNATIQAYQDNNSGAIARTFGWHSYIGLLIVTGVVVFTFVLWLGFTRWRKRGVKGVCCGRRKDKEKVWMEVKEGCFSPEQRIETPQMKDAMEDGNE